MEIEQKLEACVAFHPGCVVAATNKRRERGRETVRVSERTIKVHLLLNRVKLFPFWTFYHVIIITIFYLYLIFFLFRVTADDIKKKRITRK